LYASKVSPVKGPGVLIRWWNIAAYRVGGSLLGSTKINVYLSYMDPIEDQHQPLSLSIFPCSVFGLGDPKIKHVR